MHSTKQRTPQACDHCRVLKMKCENGQDQSKACIRCAMSRRECTYKGATKKRGPPKGYLFALEQRVQRAEGLLGAIVTSTDPRAISFTSDLAKDHLAKAIISSTLKNTSGPAEERDPYRYGRGHTRSFRRRRDESRESEEKPSIDNNGHLVFKNPSEMWRRYLDHRLAAQRRAASQVIASEPDAQMPGKESDGELSAALEDSNSFLVAEAALSYSLHEFDARGSLEVDSSESDFPYSDKIIIEQNDVAESNTDDLSGLLSPLSFDMGSLIGLEGSPFANNMHIPVNSDTIHAVSAGINELLEAFPLDVNKSRASF